jgi:hypothetical protein
MHPLIKADQREAVLTTSGEPALMDAFEEFSERQ